MDSLDSYETIRISNYRDNNGYNAFLNLRLVRDKLHTDYKY
jgi:hypothetical protein